MPIASANSFPFLVALSARMLEPTAADELRALGMTMTEVELLAAIEANPNSTLAQLEFATRLDRMSILTASARLLKAGFVASRGRSLRSGLGGLSESGRSALADGAAAIERAGKRFVDAVQSRDVSTITAALAACIAASGKPTASPPSNNAEARRAARARERAATPSP